MGHYRWMDGRMDGWMDGRYHSIPAFSLKSVGIIISLLSAEFAHSMVDIDIAKILESILALF